MANANELLGLLHGVYGAGAVLSPLAATSIINKANRPWYFFYYIMVWFARNWEKYADGMRLGGMRRRRTGRVSRVLLGVNRGCVP